MIRFATAAAAVAFATACLPLHAATLRVGADSACDFHFLPAAIEAARRSAGPTEIRLARNTRHRLDAQAALTLEVSFTGGYSSCADQSALGSTTLEVASDAVAQAIAGSTALQRVRLQAGAGEQAVVDAGAR